MADVLIDKEDDAKESNDVRRTRAPRKKKFDEEMDTLCVNIHKKEDELETLKTGAPANMSETLKESRTEVKTMIERRKRIDDDLEKLNKEITSMMNNISRIESTLHYRSEQKIDDAIGRLDWSLKAQNFSLPQEKKIVAEIDSLRRSKKTLMQYLSMKKEKDGMRDRQRKMRQERDHCFHAVTNLKQKEDKIKADNMGRRSKIDHLKRELDVLYEAKRQMASVYKRQRDDFLDDREKRRHESFKKRQEEKQAFQDKFLQEREEFEAQRQPHQDNICLCNTLLIYLQRYISNTDLDASTSGVVEAAASQVSASEESSATGVGPAEELEDGFKLLRKSDDENYYVSCSARHAARKQRRSRKASLVKRITHTPEVLAQFLQLNLSAPATMAEILTSVQQLQLKKAFYEREAEVKSEAELSVTESAQMEMSRQASHTESSDGVSDPRPGEQVVNQLLQLSLSDEGMAGHQLGAASSGDHDVLCQQIQMSPLGRTNFLWGLDFTLSAKHDLTSPSILHSDDFAQPYSCFSHVQGPSFASMVAGDHVEADFLNTPLEDDFPALVSSDSELAMSRSRSDGSDLTPQNTSLVESASEGQDSVFMEPAHLSWSSRKSLTFVPNCANGMTGDGHSGTKPLSDAADADVLPRNTSVRSRSQSMVIPARPSSMHAQPAIDPAECPTAACALCDQNSSLQPSGCVRTGSCISHAGNGWGRVWKDCSTAALLAVSMQDFPALASRACASLEECRTADANLGGGKGGLGPPRPASGAGFQVLSVSASGDGLSHSPVFKDERSLSRRGTSSVTESSHL